MTPKEKAKELVDKFSKLSNYGSYALRLCEYTSKQCAIIAIDQILKTFPNINGIAVYEDHVVDIEYWQQVKEEIENL